MAKRKAFGISKDLNEGISQTINAVKNNAGQLRYEIIPLSKIKLDPENPRQLVIQPNEILNDPTLSDPHYEIKKNELENLKSLAASIKKTGVRNAIEVYKDGMDYRLISGERRVLGSILAGKEDIQARVLDTRPSEHDIRYLQWIENVEREDLSIWDRINNVKQLISTYAEMNKTEVTASVLKEILGCSLPHAMTYLAILQAPTDLQELLKNNLITSLEKAAFLAKIENTQLRARLIKYCIEENISLAGLKKLSKENERITKEMKTIAVQGKGRAAKRVTLGYTNKISVAKKLVDLMLPAVSSQELGNRLKQIDWQDYSSVSKGFQVLIKLMEKECS